MVISQKHSAFFEAKSLKDWSKDFRCKVEYATLRNRFYNGWNLEKALTTKADKFLQEAFGEKKRICEWTRDKRCIVDANTARVRFFTLKWSLEEALTTPLQCSPVQSLIGKIFGYNFIESYAGKNKHQQSLVWCRCLYKNCNKLFKIKTDDRERIQGCGCLGREIRSNTAKRHGMSKSPLYGIWKGFNGRCYNSTDKAYKNYGERGIYVSNEWKRGQENEAGLLNFLKWCEQNPRPNLDYSLDRIDNDGPYSTQNCRWATDEQQNFNRRCPKFYEVKLKAKDEIIKQLKNEIDTLKCVINRKE